MAQQYIWSNATMTLPARLRWLREQNGYTLRNVPGFSHTSLWQYETGRRRPTPEKLEQLARVYGVSVASLTGTGDRRGRRAQPRQVTVRRIEGLMGRNEWHKAYLLCRDLIRYAGALGDPELVAAAEQRLRDIMPRLDRDAVWKQVVADTTTLPEIDYLMNLLRGLPAPPWAVLLDLTTIFLQRAHRDHPDRPRMCRRRAYLWYVLGEFELAAAWYARVVAEYPTMPYAIRYVQILSERVAAWHAGRPLAAIPYTPLIQENSLLWQLYWDAEYHAAWHARDRHAVMRAYRVALATSQARWDPPPTTVLAGCHAMAQWAQGNRGGLDELSVLLAALDPSPDPGEWAETLYQDYLRVLTAADDPAAWTTWAAYVVSLAAAGRLGWVRYWLAREPASAGPPDPVMARRLTALRSRCETPAVDPLLSL